MSAILITDGLLKEAKEYLDITWDDDATDGKLRGQIRRGIAYLSDKTGVEKSASAFSSETGDDRAQGLLFNYLLYDRAGAFDEFEKNYASEINSLRRRKEAENYAAKAED